MISAVSELPPPVSLFESVLAGGKYGRYAPVQVLGRGTEGAVVLLRSAEGAHVVSKQIALGLSVNSAQLSRIETEIAMLRLCAHPRVIQYHAVFVAMDRVNIIQEFASGGTLAEAILRQQGFPTPRLCFMLGEAALRSSKTPTPFAPRRVWRWMREVVGALRHMHSLGVIHRDVSSTNLLIDERDGIKLSDFGNAALLPPVGQMPHEKRAVGTPYYMSPQAIRCEPPGSGETDVWSFGVVCFELLSLQRPFRAESFEELAPLIEAGTYDEAALAASPHDAALCALVTRDALLHVDAERRATLAHVDTVLDSLAHLYAEGALTTDAITEEEPSQSVRSTPASTAGPDITPPTAHSQAIHSQAATPAATPHSSSPTVVASHDGTSMPPSIRRRSKSRGCSTWSSSSWHSAPIEAGSTAGSRLDGDDYDALTSTEAMAISHLGSPRWTTPLAAPRPRQTSPLAVADGGDERQPSAAAEADAASDAADSVGAEADFIQLVHAADMQGGSAAEADAAGGNVAANFVRRSQKLVKPLFSRG